MRTSAFIPAACTTIALSAGQQYQLWSGHGSIVVVQSGSITLRESPSWLAETMLSLRVDLQQEQHYPISRSGWTCIMAIRDAEVVVYTTATSTKLHSGTRFRQLLALAAVILQRLRGKVQRLAHLLTVSSER